YGIEAASSYFFDKSAKDLTIAEAAMLAGIPKGPTYYSPINHPENAKERQKHILALLNKHDEITDEEYQAAKEEDLQFTEAVAKDETKEIGTGGYEIQTTLDIELQESRSEEHTSELQSRFDLV